MDKFRNVEVGKSYKAKCKDKVIDFTVLKENKSSYRVKVKDKEETLWIGKDLYTKEPILYFREMVYHWSGGRNEKVVVEIIDNNDVDRVITEERTTELQKRIESYENNINGKYEIIKELQKDIMELKQLRDKCLEELKEVQNGKIQ